MIFLLQLLCKTSTNVLGQRTERLGKQLPMSPFFYPGQESQVVCLCTSLLYPSTDPGQIPPAVSWELGASLLLLYSILGNLVTTLHQVIIVVLKVRQLELGRLAFR